MARKASSALGHHGSTVLGSTTSPRLMSNSFRRAALAGVALQRFLIQRFVPSVDCGACVFPMVTSSD